MEHSKPQVELSDEGFKTAIHRSLLPVLVEFWAEWSGGCHMMAPILESLAESLAGRVTVLRMNIEQCPRTAKQYGVHTVPTLLLFRSGKLVESVSGSMPRSELAQRLEMNLHDPTGATFGESSTRSQ